MLDAFADEKLGGKGECFSLTFATFWHCDKIPDQMVATNQDFTDLE